jgi:hypothetical protein
MEVRGNYAYLANEGYGLQIINISDPEKAFIMKEVDTYSARGVDINSNYVYLVGADSGISLVDITEIQNSRIVTNINNDLGFTSLKAKDNIVYIGNFWHGLNIYDVSDITNVHLLQTIGTKYYPWYIYIKGDYVYVVTSDYMGGLITGSNYHSSLEIYDLSDIYHPQSIKSIDINGIVRQVVVDGNYAYLANGFNGLCIVDISNPANASVLKNQDVSGSEVEAVAIKDGKAYVGGNLGLRILDISNLENIYQIEVVPTDLYIEKITVIGKHAFLVGGKELNDNTVGCFAVVELINDN